MPARSASSMVSSSFFSRVRVSSSDSSVAVSLPMFHGHTRRHVTPGGLQHCTAKMSTHKSLHTPLAMIGHRCFGRRRVLFECRYPRLHCVDFLSELFFGQLKNMDSAACFLKIFGVPLVYLRYFGPYRFLDTVNLGVNACNFSPGCLELRATEGGREEGRDIVRAHVTSRRQ